MAKTVEETREIMETTVEEGAEVARVATDAVSDVAEVVDDYKITAGDVAILGFAAIGAGTAAYALFKGGKKLYSYFKNKRMEKDLDESEDVIDESFEDVRATKSVSEQSDVPEEME